MLRLRNHTPEGRIFGTLLEQPTMKKEHDFTEGVRGKYVKRFEKGTNLVLLEPEVAKYFPTAKAVNRALKSLISEGKIDLPHKELK